MTNDTTSQLTSPLSAQLSRAEIDLGLRRFMLSVYNYMGFGLALTGLVAYLAAESGLYGSLVKTPILLWAIVLAPLPLVFILSFRIERMSIGAAQAVFCAYAALIGLSLSGVFLVYTGVSVARTFFITAVTFLTMSLFGYTTRTDLARIGSFPLMGLIGIIVAGLVNLFLASSALQLAISIIGVIVFVGLTAYDTQRIPRTPLRASWGRSASCPPRYCFWPSPQAALERSLRPT